MVRQYRWRGQSLGGFCDKGVTDDRPSKGGYERLRRHGLGQVFALGSVGPVVGRQEGQGVNNEWNPRCPCPNQRCNA